jgi:hypothetical protein
VCSLIVNPSAGERILTFHAIGGLILAMYRGCYEVTPYVDIPFTKDHCRLCRRYIPWANRLLRIACHGQETGNEGKRCVSASVNAFLVYHRQHLSRRSGFP